MRSFISLLIILGISGLIINSVWMKLKPKELASPIPRAQVKKVITPSPTSLPVSDSLKTVVKGALVGSTGNYGIVIKNLITGEAYYSNEHRSYDPGSLYKLWVMATVFNQIQNAKLSEDEILSQDVQVLNKEFDVDPDYAELTEGTITLNVKDALEQMITISHNTAALLLTDKVQLSSIESFLQQNRLTESAIGEPPRTTAFDVALFFEKLYKGQLANEDNTKEMIELLKRQTLNNKLPKYLPQDVAVAHKTGEIDYLSHDAGIVFTGKGDYIIAILSETDNPPGAEERIAQVSSAVYKYFMDEET